MEIPVTRDLAARITETDLDLVRPADPAGASSPATARPAGRTTLFTGLRAAAARYGRILVITGSRDLLPDGYQTSPDHVAEVMGHTYGALVLLTAHPAATGLPPAQPQPDLQ